MKRGTRFPLGQLDYFMRDTKAALGEQQETMPSRFITHARVGPSRLSTRSNPAAAPEGGGGRVCLAEASCREERVCCAAAERAHPPQRGA